MKKTHHVIWKTKGNKDTLQFTSTNNSPTRSPGNERVYNHASTNNPLFGGGSDAILYDVLVTERKIFFTFFGNLYTLDRSSFVLTQVINLRRKKLNNLKMKKPKSFVDVEANEDSNDEEELNNADGIGFVDEFSFQSNITSISIRNGVLMVGSEGPFIHFIEEKSMLYLSSFDLSSQVGCSSMIMFPSWKKEGSDVSHHSFGDQFLRG